MSDEFNRMMADALFKGTGYSHKDLVGRYQSAFGKAAGGDHIDDRDWGHPRSLSRVPPKLKEYVEDIPDEPFEDIVGNKEAMTSLMSIIRGPSEEDKNIYEAYGLTQPNGVLLQGPPGCGKTMFARAAAYEMKKAYGSDQFINIPGSTIQSKWAGETEETIRSIFKYAKDYYEDNGHKLLVFIDEAEVILPCRETSVSYKASNVATFLGEMDGINKSHALIILATNRPEEIDQAVIREGRCDYKIKVKRPDQKTCEELLKRLLKNQPLGESVESMVFAASESLFDPFKIIHEAKAIHLADKKVSGKNFTMEHILSGAMLNALVTKAKLHAFNRDKGTGKLTGITSVDIHRAVEDLFKENRGLNHSYAVREFMEEFKAEVESD